MSDELLDARGVEIEPGDTAIYGFGVGRSVAMAEAVVLGAHGDHKACLPPCLDEVSLTPSGRVRLRVVRRSYSSGEKPVVDVAPDRLVVLKAAPWTGSAMPFLPSSPLPTQTEEERRRIENLIEVRTADLRATEVPDRSYWRDEALVDFHAYAAERLTELRRKLKALDGDQV